MASMITAPNIANPSIAREPGAAAACGGAVDLSALSPSNHIVVCGRRYELNARIVSWTDNQRISAYSLCCYSGPDGQSRSEPFPYRPAKGMATRATRYRPRRELIGRTHDLEILQRVISQVVIHHDGAASSLDCFHILHDERGLSAHFLVDNDGTIYQTMDLADAAFHAQEVNGVSIGIEVCNRGLLLRTASAASTRGRSEQFAAIHGQSHRMWSFTDEQYRALGQLARLLMRLFPRLVAASPREAGKPLYTVLGEPLRFAGFVGHYHVSTRKWDPGCFDFDHMLALATMRSVGPPAAPLPPTASPEQMPKQTPEQATLEALLRADAEPTRAGVYPLGPCGDDVVFHGGVHLLLPRGAPWLSPLAGQVVAARLNQPDSAVGSPNFVLTRHEVELGGRRLTFFLLVAHVQALKPGSAPPWWQRVAARERQPGAEVAVIFPAAPVAAGELLAHVGVAGPPGHHQPQVHLEALSVMEQTTALVPGRFRVYDCGSSGPICLAPELRALLGGRSPATLLTARDQAAAAALRALRQVAVRYRSEWAPLSAAEFMQRLGPSRAYRRLPPADQHHVFNTQVRPMFWLNPEVAARTGLPEDAELWHYHPLELLAMVADLCRGSVVPTPGAATATASSDGVESDDEGYTSEEDQLDWQLDSRPLDFDDVSLGYPSHWLAR